MLDLLSDYADYFSEHTLDLPERVTSIDEPYIRGEHIVHDIILDGEHEHTIVIYGETPEDLYEDLVDRLEMYQPYTEWDEYDKMRGDRA